MIKDSNLGKDNVVRRHVVCGLGALAGSPLPGVGIQ